MKDIGAPNKICDNKYLLCVTRRYLEKTSHILTKLAKISCNMPILVCYSISEAL
jgi:hypothetical protein